MGKDAILRLVGVVKQIADRHPENLPRFFRARRKRELRAIHRVMGIGFEEHTRARIRESLAMGVKGHAALLWTTWPEKYADPPAPPPERVVTISELVALRLRRFAAKLHMYSDLDQLALQDRPRPSWNFMSKTEQSERPAKTLHLADGSDEFLCER